MTAKYHRIKETVQSWIIQGKVRPHQKIHSEKELAGMFAVSRHTIRQAIGQLVQEGWLYRERGSGTYCADRTTGRDRQTTKTIGVLTTYISDYIFPSIIRGIEGFMTEHEYTMLLASTNNDIEHERKCLQNLLARDIDGLIVEPTKSARHNPNINYYLQLEARGIPFVMIHATYPELHPPGLLVNDEHGGYLATNHLLKLGHRDVVGIFKTDDIQGEKRMQGYFRAHREHGLTVQPGMVISYSTEEEAQTMQEVREMFARKTDVPTAIVCYNDALAFQAMDEIRQCGWRVPQDVSIVGYDDSHLAQAADLKLTSVTHPKRDMGETAARCLLDLMEKRQTGADMYPYTYQPELIVRQSTSKPRQYSPTIAE